MPKVSFIRFSGWLVFLVAVALLMVAQAVLARASGDPATVRGNA